MRMKGKAQCVSKCPPGAYSGPVSYTHLDVYKRQLMGKAYEITGGAKAVARLFIKLFTVRFAPYAIFLAIVVMTWGGIAGFVLAFSVFPIAVEIFREADLPRSMIPGIVIAGCCTISSWGPGSAQPVNNIYATNFQTSLMGAPVRCV